MPPRMAMRKTLMRLSPSDRRYQLGLERRLMQPSRLLEPEQVILEQDKAAGQLGRHRVQFRFRHWPDLSAVKHLPRLSQRYRRVVRKQARLPVAVARMTLRQAVAPLLLRQRSLLAVVGGLDGLLVTSASSAWSRRPLRLSGQSNPRSMSNSKFDGGLRRRKQSRSKPPGGPQASWSMMQLAHGPFWISTRLPRPTGPSC